MAKPRRSRRILTIVVLVLISLTIITVDETGRSHHITSGLRSVANDIYQPIRTAVDDVISPVGDFFAGAVHYGSLQQENERLQATIGRLQQGSEERPFQAEQLHQVMALQKLPYLGALQTVTAQTEQLDPSDFVASILISKGRNDGVSVGNPVVGAGGLVGQVVQANHSTSVVRLLTDGQSSVGVSFGPGESQTAVVNGHGPGNPLSVDFVAPGTALQRGERVFTNQLQGGEYPAGIPVASITSFHTVTGASQMTVSARPLADLHDLAYVDVVQWEPPP